MNPFILNFIALMAIAFITMVSFAMFRSLLASKVVNVYDSINICVGMSTAYLLYFYELV